MEGAFVVRQPAGVRLLAWHLSTGEVTPNWAWAAAPSAAGVGAVRARLDDLVRYAQAHLGREAEVSPTCSNFCCGAVTSTYFF